MRKTIIGVALSALTTATSAEGIFSGFSKAKTLGYANAYLTPAPLLCANIVDDDKVDDLKRLAVSVNRVLLRFGADPAFQEGMTEGDIDATRQYSKDLRAYCNTALRRADAKFRDW
jgi:hypothetical protein